MAYTEKLSEQLAVSDLVAQLTGTVSASGSTTVTGNGIDMSGYHRLVAIAYGEAQAVSSSSGTGTVSTTASTAMALTVQIQASTSSAFGGTPTTITTVSSSFANTVTATATGTAVSATATATLANAVKVDVSGEDVQGARAAQDRYVRAVITMGAGAGNGLANGFGIVLGDTRRFKPAGDNE